MHNDLVEQAVKVQISSFVIMTDCEAFHAFLESFHLVPGVAVEVDAVMIRTVKRGGGG